VLRFFKAMVIVLASAGAAPACAQTYFGHGGGPCSWYNDARQNDARQKDGSPLKLAFEAYAHGYVSGMNAAIHATTGRDPLADETAFSVFYFLRRYCEQNPDRTILNGLNAYVGSLGRRSSAAPR
jgi:hypothetical protein